MTMITKIKSRRKRQRGWERQRFPFFADTYGHLRTLTGHLLDIGSNQEGVYNLLLRAG